MKTQKQNKTAIKENEEQTVLEKGQPSAQHLVPLCLSLLYEMHPADCSNTPQVKRNKNLILNRKKLLKYSSERNTVSSYSLASKRRNKTELKSLWLHTQKDVADRKRINCIPDSLQIGNNRPKNNNKKIRRQARQNEWKSNDPRQ